MFGISQKSKVYKQTKESNDSFVEIFVPPFVFLKIYYHIVTKPYESINKYH
jgi:hypothetical protein